MILHATKTLSLTKWTAAACLSSVDLLPKASLRECHLCPNLMRALREMFSREEERRSAKEDLRFGIFSANLCGISAKLCVTA